MPVKKNAEITAVDASNFKIETIDTTLTADDISEELDGLGNIPLDRAKFPGSGGTQFEIVDDDDDDNSTMTDSIEGIIAYHHAMNSRWEKGYDGSQEPPTCSSIDGKVGLNVKTGEVITCEGCPYNQYGTAEGNSKACKNIHRLFIIRDGNPVPLIVALPPTSLKSFRNYVSKKLLLKGRKTNQVLTRITLKGEKNQNNMKYSKAVFEKIGDLNDKQKEDALKIGDFVKGIIAAEAPITADDYNVTNTNGSEVVSHEEPAEAPQLPSAINEEKQPAPSDYPEAPIPNDAPPVKTANSTPPANSGFDFIDVEPSDGNPFA